ncbi:MAG: hypothetical protein ACRYGI_02600 [Janthinobacterium lividum]
MLVARIDVYAGNPCDPLERKQDYSPLAAIAISGAVGQLDPAFRVPGGTVPDALGLAGLFSNMVAVCAVVSWATLFAAEPSNTDLLIFTAATLFVHLLMRSAIAWSAGYALVLGIELLKFYPLTVLAFIVHEPWRRMWLVGGLCGLVLAVFLAEFHAELSRIGANMGTGLFSDMFGARSMPLGLILL